MSVVTENFDCVVMLTWSDWNTEMRSNRYHYATRLAKHVPVLFVQVQRDRSGFQKVPDHDIYILTIGEIELLPISKAMEKMRLKQPLVWVYNVLFSSIIDSIFSPLKIYHASEDYFSADFNQDQMIVAHASRLLSQVDMVLCVSEGVEANIKKNAPSRVKTVTIANGCDFDFWYRPEAAEPRQKVVLYQGGISKKLDYDLLIELVDQLPDWKFWFCGDILALDPKWKVLLKKQNVKYFGCVSPEKVCELSHSARVGIIPFHENDWLTYRSFPLKAFEYAASGLAVVSTPIESLLKFGDLFNFCQGTAQFATQISRFESDSELKRGYTSRVEQARLHNYDDKFKIFLSELSDCLRSLSTKRNPLRAKVLVLYDAPSANVGTIKEHLESFRNYSRQNIFFLSTDSKFRPIVDLGSFDVVVVHYSVRISFPKSINTRLFKQLRFFRGVKILFLQDEYDNVETARVYMERTHFQIVYTCVPEEYFEAVYPRQRFPFTRFINNLTGYVPDDLDSYEKAFVPLEKRKNIIAYRGRDLPFWYGDLGQEKMQIGVEAKKRCAALNIPHDIEWESSFRIYGERWYGFLGNAVATLGTESGSNVFDFDGSLKKKISKELNNNPEVTFEFIRSKYLSGVEGLVKMNQVSPKIFESILLKVALVLFEGSYSNVLLPDVHYLPLKKDFSNFESILNKLADHDFVRDMTERAYRDVISSKKFSYVRFIDGVDQNIAHLCRHLVNDGNLTVVNSDINATTSIVYSSPFVVLPDTSALFPRNILFEFWRKRPSVFDVVKRVVYLAVMVVAYLAAVPYSVWKGRSYRMSVHSLYNSFRLAMRGTYTLILRKQ